MTEGPLATFVDRDTMVYERRYPHPIERVWEAVSTGEHLDVWMLPESRVERRVGGACAFGWGGPADDPGASVGEVTVFEPPTAIQFTFRDGSTMRGDASFMRFDLTPDADGTTLAFTLHYLPGDGAEQDYPGGDLPAGPDTAWRPGFLTGYHEMVDRLDGFLRGDWTSEDAQRDLERQMAEGFAPESLALIETYRQHVAANCPPA